MREQQCCVVTKQTAAHRRVLGGVWTEVPCGDICTICAEMVKWYKSDRAAAVTAAGNPELYPPGNRKVVYVHEMQEHIRLWAREPLPVWNVCLQEGRVKTLCDGPSFCKFYGNPELLILQFFQIQSLQSYFMYLCKRQVLRLSR